MFVAALLVGVAKANVDDFFYYRSENYETERWVSETLRVVEWPNASFRIFDSVSDVTVSRYDAFGTSVIPELRSGDGGAYLFTTAKEAQVVDGWTVDFAFDEMVVVSGSACFQVLLGEANASLLVVSSGTPADECAAATYKNGTTELHNNAVDYVANGSCADPIYGAPGYVDYDGLDGPVIPALAQHYHTRGALYYVGNGSATFDAGVDPLLPGELRFVQVGYYYGPESFSNGTHVLSVHEPDPRSMAFDTTTTTTDDEDDYSPCPIACLDDPDTSAGPAITCVNPVLNVAMGGEPIMAVE